LIGTNTASVADDCGGQSANRPFDGSLIATVAQRDKLAKLRLRAFLDRKTAKAKPT
jgi:hypothetical protein